MTFALFPSFFEKPEHISFFEQDADENIVLFLRRHWFTNVGWIVTALLLILLPFFLATLSAYAVFQLPISIPLNILQGALLLWYMIIFSYILESFLSWYFNIYIVTNKHLVQVQFDSLLSRKVIQSQLEDIQGVSAGIKGIFGSLFNFGDVHIETAAYHENILFTKVPFPDIVANTIEELQPLEDSNAG